MSPTDTTTDTSHEACRHPGVHMGFVVFGDGTRHLVEWCPACESKRSEWLPKKSLAELRIDPASVPVVLDYRLDANPCDVCGSTGGTQLHHWAPQSLESDFGAEYKRWPTAWLCRAHHDLWHASVTPHFRVGSMRVSDIMAGARKGTLLRELLDAAREIAVRHTKQGDGEAA